MGKEHAATGKTIRLAVAGMSALEHAPLAPALELDHIAAREAFAARAAALPRRRGWLMPKMLLLADLTGLTAALP